MITGLRRRSDGILAENANSSPFTREMRYASKISLFFSFFFSSREKTAPLGNIERAKTFFFFRLSCFASRPTIEIFDESHDLSFVHSSHDSFIKLYNRKSK